MKPIALLVISLLCWLATFGQSAAERARNAYDAGQYTKAAALYDSLWQSGIDNVAVHYNLGNCYYRLGSIGKSVLHYEKALRLDPDNQDIRFNLQLANLRVTDRVATSEPSIIGAAWQRFLNMVPLSGWSTITLITLLLSALLLGWFIYRWKKQPQPIAFIGGIGMLVVGLLLILITWQRYLLQEPTREAAIIMVPNVYVKAAPDTGSTDLFIIHEGLKVTVQEQQDGWMRIAVDGDKVGWVPADEVAVI